MKIQFRLISTGSIAYKHAVLIKLTRRLTLWVALLGIQICHVILAVWLLIAKLGRDGMASVPTLAVDLCFIAPSALAIFSAVQKFAQ